MTDTNLSSPSISADREPLFQALISATVDGVIVISPDGTIRVFNAACQRLFGYGPAEVFGRNVQMLMPAPYRAEHDQYLSHFLQTGQRRIIGIGREVQGRHKNGSVFPMDLSVGEGHLDGERFFVGIVRDLTSLKSEIALREDADRLLAQIVQSSNDAILSKTLGGVITSWNRAAERIFGYAADEAIGQHISLLIPHERLAEEDEIIAKLKSGRNVEHFRTIRRHKNGNDIMVSISVSLIRDAAGHIFGASKTVRDVTSHVQAEARLREMQSELAHAGRLNSMGQMSSALAHELNQPLTAVTNFAEAARLTLANCEDPAAIRAIELIDRASRQTLRAGAIIRNLRDFVEKRESERRPEDLNAIVEEAAALALAGAADSGVKVTLDLSPSLPLFLIDRIQIQQVLLNLIRNAVEAMLTSEKRELAIATRVEDDGVTLTVRDTGPGFTPEAQERLFEPFNTTKEKGMGIGLTICKSIVEAHGGHIWAEHHNGCGAVFVVHLPQGAIGEFAS